MDSEKSVVDELPLAIVRRVVKEKLSECSPDYDVSIHKEALLAFSESARIFIHYLSATANDICKDSRRQTMKAEDVFKALEDMEFSEFLEPLKASLDDFKKKNAGKKAGGGGGGGGGAAAAASKPKETKKRKHEEEASTQKGVTKSKRDEGDLEKNVEDDNTKENEDDNTEENGNDDEEEEDADGNEENSMEENGNEDNSMEEAGSGSGSGEDDENEGTGEEEDE